MDAYQSVGFNFWMVAAIVAIVVVALLLIVFLVGFRAGLNRTEQIRKSIAYYQRDREHRRIIRMQAAPKPKKSSSYTGYYPGVQARRNQAKYRRARREQTKMRNK